VGNVLQYQKNENDARAAEQQIEIAKQQADTAKQSAEAQFNSVKDVEEKNRRDEAACEARRPEHDDALKAVHQYDESITKNQARAQLERSAMAMAETDKDDFHVTEHRSLAEGLEQQIKDLTTSRDQAAARVQQLEQGCKF
jgi:hypothetical protein